MSLSDVRPWEQLDSLVTFQCRILPPGFQRPPVSDPVTTDCLCSQLRLVYLCHPLQLWQDAYVTQRTTHDHQLSLAENNYTNRFSPRPPSDSSMYVLGLSCMQGWTVEVRLRLLTLTTALALNQNTWPEFEAYSLWNRALRDKIYWSSWMVLLGLNRQNSFSRI